METPNSTLEEIAQKVKEGYTSGRVDVKEDSTTVFTSWELNTNTWCDDAEED